MTKETIILAELDIDIKKLTESKAQIDKQISALIDAQYRLMESGKQSSRQFKDNEVAIDKLRGAYDAQAAIIKEQLALNAKLIANQQQLETALATTNATENEYIANNQKLIALKKELNVNSSNYKANIALINAKLQENNNWLKENGSEHARLITTMSDYKNMVTESFNSINVFNGGITGFISRAQEAGGVGPLLKNAFSGITTGIKGMGAALMANPIGAVISLVGGLMEVFKSFKPVMDVLQQGMAAVGAVIDSVKNSIIGLLTGATSISDFFSGFAGSAADAATEAIKLKEAQQKLAEQTAQQAVANEEAKNSIAEYMRTVQDSTKTEEERLEALNNAAAVEKDNLDQRKKNAEEQYNLTVRELANGKNLTDKELEQLKEKGFAYAQELAARKSISQEELDMLQKAQIEREKIYGEEAELSHKQAGDLKKFHAEMQAQKDADAQKDMERRQKLLDDALQKQKQQLDLFVAEAGAKAQTLQQQLKFEDDYAQKSIAILQNELKQKKISQTEYATELANITTQQMRNKAQIAADFAKAELDLYVQQNKSLIKNGEAITAELVTAEKARLETIYQMNVDLLQKKSGLNFAEVEAKRNANQQLTLEETRFYTEMLALNEQHQADIDETDQAKVEADTAAKQAKRDEEAAARKKEYENKIALADNEYEAQRLKEEERFAEEAALLEQRKADGLISQAEYDAQLEALKQESSNNMQAIDKAERDNKLSLAKATYTNLATLLGKENEAAKAMAMAQATIDTYHSAVSAYKSMAGIPVVGPALGAAAAGAAVVAGMQNVKKIASTKTPKAEKGALFSIGGNRHSAGGTMFRGEDGTAFEAEQGELIGVMNRNAARHFMAFNNAFPSGGAAAPNYFAGGGIVSREIASPALNTDELAAKIAEANRAIPAPVVSVQDIVTEGNSYVQVRNGANF